MKTFTRTPIALAARTLVYQLHVEHRLKLLAERKRLRAEMARTEANHA